MREVPSGQRTRYDPLMPSLRCQAVFQGASGLPEDRFVNTFHFTWVTGDSYLDMVAAATAKVDDFYTASPGTEAAIGSYLSPYVNRAFVVKGYDLSLPPGEREPFEWPSTLPATTATGLPEEVAICLTIRGAPPVTPRRRGRIYIGPLSDTTNVIVPASTGGPARPKVTSSNSVTEAILESAAALAGGPGLPVWSIRSVTPTENFVLVNDGYIDNAFDTQRRRGPDPDFRNFFS